MPGSPESALGLWRRLLRLMGEQRGRLLLIAGAILIELAFLSGLPYSFRFIVDYGILAGDHAFLKGLLLALVVAACVYALIGVLRDRLLARLIARVLARLRELMYARIAGMPMVWHHQQPRTELLARYSGDLAAVEQALTAAAPWALIPALEVLANTALLFTLDYRLAVLSLLVFPVAWLGPRGLMGPARRVALQRRDQEATLLAELDEQIAAQRVLRAYGQSGAAARRFHQLQQRLEEDVRRQGLLGALVERTANAGILLLNVLLLAFGVWLVVLGELSVGELAAFQALFLSLSWALSYLAQYLPIWLAATAGHARIEQVIAQPVPEARGRYPFARLQRGVVFDAVGFRYGDRTAVERVDFTLAYGRTLALVGGSGAGKSTLVGLLLGFIAPTHGRIVVDGRDLATVDLERWRAQLGVVFQDTLLLRGTLRSNLLLARPEASAAELEQALREAGLERFVGGLPRGLDTLIDPAQGNVSGGQRQRIGIARALLRNPALLVLDEATAALDPETEAEIEQTLFQLGQRRTVLMVTHRLQQAARCNRIVVLEQGRVAEMGQHEDLLSKCGAYARLWRKQQGFSLAEQGAAASVSAQRLAEIGVFAELPHAVLVGLTQAFRSERVAAGAVLVREGEIGDRFWLVVRGLCEVYRITPEGETSIATLSDGDHFGEIALLDARPRTAHVRALTGGTLLWLGRSAFEALIATDPAVANRMREVAAQRLQSLGSA